MGRQMVRAGLGELERRVLMAIVHLRGRGYAVSINDEIKRRFGKSISLGATYATVDRMEKKGLVEIHARGTYGGARRQAEAFLQHHGARPTRAVGCPGG